jgi:hypothetical protein
MAKQDPSGAKPAKPEPVRIEPLVRMTDGAHELHVHPSCVEAHKAAGWLLPE